MIVDRIAYRRNLPHFQNANKIYFITFVTIRRWILPAEARDVVLTEIQRIQKDEGFVHAAVVMPEHVHLVLQPLWDARGLTYPLSVILKLLKGRSSRRINQRVNRSGTVWLDESDDHQIRSDESLVEKIDYVLANPVRRQLETPYPWLYRWWDERPSG